MKINNKMFLLSLVFILLVGSIIPIFINTTTKAFADNAYLSPY